MGVQRTRTVKNKHAANKSGVPGSKSSKKPAADGVAKKPRRSSAKALPPSKQVKPRGADEAARKKRRKKVYSAEELGVPRLNMITPVGVEKPRGKKKGKVFVDDRESMSTILSIVQAEKEGQIESKIMKARQMEEIREARRVEAEKKEEQRRERLEDTKNSLRKRRKRKAGGGEGEGEGGESVKDVALMGSKANKTRKKVSFA